MKTAVELRSGKGHLDENFPVASRLIHRRHRAVILAFYNFVRTADDIADHASLSAEEKLELLDALEDDLVGGAQPSAEAGRLRQALDERGLTPRHAQDLLRAFRMDASKLRYRDWNDLMDYCSYSAMPVGRFVLDVHGERRETWTFSDPLCAALQIINHLQDCSMDYRRLNRVYIPLEAFARADARVEALAGTSADPALRRCFDGICRGVEDLLRKAEPLALAVSDLRLGLEIAVIQRLAKVLSKRLQRRDPLSERVHLSSGEAAATTLAAIVHGLSRRARQAIAPVKESAVEG
ncbi:MAG: squalene synthase HpnC [Aestuariivirgaceae bacterium]